MPSCPARLQSMRLVSATESIEAEKLKQEDEEANFTSVNCLLDRFLQFVTLRDLEESRELLRGHEVMKCLSWAQYMH